ncbi:hypothetical protein AWJ20_1880 [Sugiyamaella lignohabitans]|uniref:Uncharacterized protein n=1 Tax=Sugiyamaella lignohabitans TaxID=796027 RepID=A0A167E381_9ASCO|nr:uncharacterized protein AWJ20_1880 [Sugiyamaella lignohabitans]ANB13583.1 hypothetical protein AWJ20_1880 [Sugiyamaella lignohabitans]
MKMTMQEIADRKRIQEMAAQVEAESMHRRPVLVVTPPLSTSPPTSNDRTSGSNSSTAGSESSRSSGLELANTPVIPPPRGGSITPPASVSGALDKEQLVQQGFDSDALRTVYCEWLSWLFMLAADSDILYDAMMAFSYGFMAIKTGLHSHQINSDIHRDKALSALQQEIAKDHIENTDTVLATALILSWDVFLQQEDIQACVTLSKGVAAVLEKVEITNSQTGMAICMRDAIMQGIKSIKMPSYNGEFLPEFLAHLDGVRDFISSGVSLGVCSSTLLDEHQVLAGIVADTIEFLDTHTRQTDQSGTAYYPPQLLFKMLRRWLRMFPSAALCRSLSGQRTTEEIVLYLYYHAFTRVLDALFPEVRYIFQFGFIGPIDLVGYESIVISNQPGFTTSSHTPLHSHYNNNGHSMFVQPSSLLQTPPSPLAISSYHDLTAYPLKVLTFFKDRLLKLNDLLVASSPLEKENYEQLLETQVTSFDTTNISHEHFPCLLSNNGKYDDFNFTFDPFSPIITPPSEPLENDIAMLSNHKKQEFFQAYFTDRMEILQSISIY